MELRGWEGMQTDCLVNIFSRLGLEDLITAVSFVCRSWNQASFDPLCQRILDFRYLDFNSSSPLALALSVPRLSFSGFFKLALDHAHGAAVDLRFPSHFSVSKQDLSLASDECPKLRNLILPRVESEDEEQLLKAISKWKELEVLEMESKPSILAEMVKQIGIHCNKFKGLKLRGSIKKEDAAAIVGCLPNLEWLDLSSCRLGRGELLAIVDGCRHLKRLSVRDCTGFEVDEEVKKRASGIELFEHEGSTIEDVCEAEDDGYVSLEQMLMYYDDCYEMWLL
ncbi:F-box/LRR-repeat protein At3g48880-like [Phalaenopsis equestris]|uniref:F-box/LRR-repeat protein At3g48880-like n=1 Tax=Phalaenopsis equestris TaxID=78828 RepID=UPI0009E2E223|nr:F-box/LRR-repeat protein At3g48880-like [Phalaenopsis equestris]